MDCREKLAKLLTQRRNAVLLFHGKPCGVSHGCGTCRIGEQQGDGFGKVARLVFQKNFMPVAQVQTFSTEGG